MGLNAGLNAMRLIAMGVKAILPKFMGVPAMELKAILLGSVLPFGLWSTATSSLYSCDCPAGCKSIVVVCQQTD